MFPTALRATVSPSPTPSHAAESCAADNLTQKIAKITAYGFIVLIGLVGNALICFIFCKNKKLRRTVNCFIFNMALSDLLVPVFVVPKEIAKISLSNGAWRPEGPVGLGLCKLSYFAQDVSFLVSILSLLFMAFERFVAIVFPMKISMLTIRVRMVLIGLTWVTAMAVHASYFYTFRLIKNEKNITTCTSTWEPAFDQVSTQRRYGIATFTIFVMVPFALLVIFYSSIGIALRRQRTCLENSACEGNNERTRREKENRKVTTLSAVIVGGFALCCIPFNIYVFVYIFGFNFPQATPCGFSTFFFVANFLVRSASAVNPCTCFAFYRSYRKSLQRMMLCSFRSTICCKIANSRHRNERKGISLGLEDLQHIARQRQPRRSLREAADTKSPREMKGLARGRCLEKKILATSPSSQETAITICKI